MTRPYHSYPQSLTSPLATSNAPGWLGTKSTAYFAANVKNVGPLYKSTVACLDAITGASLHDVVDVEGFPTCVISDGSGGIYVSGKLTHVAGANTPGQSVVHLNSNGTLDSGFSLRFSGSMGGYFLEPQVTSMVLLSGTLYLGGFGLCTLNGTYLPGTSLCAVNATTGAKVAWDPFTSPVTGTRGTTGNDLYSSPEIQYLVTDGTSIYASGTFVVVSNSITHTGFLKIDATTAVIDDTYLPSSGLNRRFAFWGTAPTNHLVVVNGTNVSQLNHVTGATGANVITGITSGVTAMVTDTTANKVYVSGIFSGVKKLATNGWQTTITASQTSLALSPDGTKLYLGNDQYDASSGAQITTFLGKTNLLTWDASVADATAFWGASEKLVTVQRSDRRAVAEILSNGSLASFNPDPYVPLVATDFANTGPIFAGSPTVTVTLPGGRAGETYIIQATNQSFGFLAISGPGGWNASPQVEFTNGGFSSIFYTTGTFWRYLSADEGPSTVNFSVTGLAWLYTDGFSVSGLDPYDYSGGVLPTATVSGTNSFTASGGAATTSDEIYLLVGGSNGGAFDPGNLTGNGSSFQSSDILYVQNFGGPAAGWQYFDTAPHRREVPSFAGSQTNPFGGHTTTGVAYVIPFPRTAQSAPVGWSMSSSVGPCATVGGDKFIVCATGGYGSLAYSLPQKIAGGSIATTTTAGANTYVFGSFTTIGGVSYVRAARIAAGSGAAGTLDAGWQPTTPITANVTVSKVNPSDTTVIYHNFLGGAHHLTALDTATGNQLWDKIVSLTGGFADVNVIAFSPDESLVYVGGLFDTVDGTAGHVGIACLNATTGALQSWNPQLWSASTFLNPLAIETIGDYVYVAGSYVLGANGLLRNGALCVKTSDATWTSTWDPVHTGDDNGSVGALLADGATGRLLSTSDPVASLHKRRGSTLQLHSGAPDSPGGPDLTSPITTGAIVQTKTFASSGNISTFTSTLTSALSRGSTLFLFLAFSNPDVKLPALSFEAGSGAVFADNGVFGPQQNQSATTWNHTTNPGFQTYQTAIYYAAGDFGEDADQDESGPQVLTAKWDVACSVACVMVEVAGLNTGYYDTDFGVIHLSNTTSATVDTTSGVVGSVGDKLCSLWGVATNGATVYSGLTSANQSYTLGPQAASTGGSGDVAVQVLWDTTSTFGSSNPIDFTVGISPSRKWAAWHWGLDRLDAGNAV